VSRAFAFHTVWRVDAPPEECWRAIERMLVPGARSWWRALRVVSAPGGLAAGADVDVVVTAPFGYRLRVRFALERVRPARQVVAAGSGDLTGRGILTLASAGQSGCRLDVDWRVVVERPWMRRTSWMLRPVFALAHALVMRAGERGLRRALA
jgi:hypothetical protein